MDSVRAEIDGRALFGLAPPGIDRDEGADDPRQEYEQRHSEQGKSDPATPSTLTPTTHFHPCLAYCALANYLRRSSSRQ
ncbi:hypothetical protein GCM10022281_12510 [Sphingomonas rosea]|uniref:Uncharacterized protein n=1 Tax=Sphingomonas rosea TaxID=335605 RepID=A0ABP7U0W7_9SPHN